MRRNNLFKMLKHVDIFFVILTHVKNLIGLVEKEDVEDGVKHGKEKKNAVLRLIGVLYDASDEFADVVISKELVLRLADNTVDVFVDLYNAIGKFRSLSNGSVVSSDPK